MKVDTVKRQSQRFQQMLTAISNTRTQFETDPVTARLATCISVFSADDVLRSTLREWVTQLRACGLSGEIFVVLNNGGGHTPYLCRVMTDPRCRAELIADVQVDSVIVGHVAPVPDLEVGVARPVRLETELPKDPSGIHLVVIQQTQSPDNAGKIRALRDLMGFLLAENRRTGYHPTWLFCMDAETRIRLTQHHDQVRDQNEGLQQLLSRQAQGFAIVGTKFHFLPYRHGEPSWQENSPWLQRVTSAIHGTRILTSLGGGGILGQFGEMVSCLAGVARYYPGVGAEDTLLTVVAKELGLRYCIERHVVHLNRCASCHKVQESVEQMQRWLRAIEGIRVECGAAVMHGIIPTYLQVVAAYLAVACTNPNTYLTLLHSGLIYTAWQFWKLQRMAVRHPDDIVHGNASWQPIQG